MNNNRIRIILLFAVVFGLVYGQVIMRGGLYRGVTISPRESGGDMPPPPPPTDSIGAEWWNVAGYPIGGGPGYADSFVVAAGNGADTFYVTDSAHFYNVMADSIADSALIYIADNAEINIGSTEWLFMDEDDIILCSGRGRTLGDTISWGGLLYTDNKQNDAPIRIYGDRWRISGLRIRGCQPHYFSANTDDYINSSFIQFYGSPGSLVDNCELYNCGFAALVLQGSYSDTVRNCYFHNTKTRGCGYGVNTGDDTQSFIQACLFDFYRHAIAGGVHENQRYDAQYNICLEHDAEFATFNRHCGGKGGDVHHNTWYAWQRTGNQVNGFRLPSTIPLTDSLTIYNTWSNHDDSAKTFSNSAGNNFVRITEMHYGRTMPDGLSGRIPTADGQIDTDSGDVPLTVTMKDEASSDPDGSITWYEWDLGLGSGDVQYVRAESTQYTYTQIGQYHPRFYVHDDLGCVDYDQFTVKVVPAGADQAKFWLSFWYWDSYAASNLAGYLEAQMLVDNDTVWSQDLNGDSVWQHVVVDVTDAVGASDSVTIQMRLVVETDMGGSYQDIHAIFDDVWGWNLTVLNGDFEADANGTNQSPDYWTAGWGGPGPGGVGWYQFMGEVASGKMSWLMKTTEQSTATAGTYVYCRQKVDVVGQ